MIEPTYEALRIEAMQTVYQFINHLEVSPEAILHMGMFLAWSGHADTFGKRLQGLQEALRQQRTYERENWPFVGEQNKPTGTGESITYHLASQYCWSPTFVLSLPEEERAERLEEIWKTFAIAGDIIKRYEDAATALLSEEKEQ